VLGVGVGTLEEEFRLLGARFDGRGPGLRGRDPSAPRRVRPARAALRRPVPSLSATSSSTRAASRSGFPIWLGWTHAALAPPRARLADGWDPFGLDLEQLERSSLKAAQWREWASRTTPVRARPADRLRFDPTRPDERDALREPDRPVRRAGHHDPAPAAPARRRSRSISSSSRSSHPSGRRRA
jgi:hypothetical protein